MYFRPQMIPHKYGNETILEINPTRTRFICLTYGVSLKSDVLFFYVRDGNIDYCFSDIPWVRVEF